jgi:xanthine/uracil/vitamin C permease (AzgA family)
MKRVLYWLNGLGFVFTSLILLTLVANHIIREWVFNAIMINLIVYLHGVGKIRRRLIELEAKSGT